MPGPEDRNRLPPERRVPLVRVLLNCAASLDGRIGLPGGKPVLLSGPEDLRRVHRLRAEVDGVLVGVNTVIADDPSLLVKWHVADLPPGRQPARVVLDAALRTPPGARVLDGRARCLVVSPVGGALHGAEIVRADPRDVRATLDALERAGLRSLLVEGGARTLASFLASGLWDRFTVYVAPRLLGEDAVPMVAGDVGPPLPPARVEKLGDGALLTFERG